MLEDIETRLKKCNDADLPKIIETRRALQTLENIIPDFIALMERQEAAKADMNP